MDDTSSEYQECSRLRFRVELLIFRLVDIKIRAMKNFNQYIEINPQKMVGKPVIKGTRITVELVLRLLAQGITVGEIIKTYPHLKKRDIMACLEYATRVIGGERVFPLPVNKKEPVYR